MNLLAENYGVSCIQSIDRFQSIVSIGIEPRTVMLLISVITTLCTAGIAFYLRFFFALCKEFTPRWINNRKPAQLRLERKWSGKRLTSKPRHSRAALQITEMPLNINFQRVEEGARVMSIQEVAPEQLAELFHHYYQALAPDFQCGSKPSETWDHVPTLEKSRLIAAARLELLELTTPARENKDSRRYFAKPGNAEWGS